MIDYAPGLVVAPLTDLFLLCSSWDKKSPGVITLHSEIWENHANLTRPKALILVV